MKTLATLTFLVLTGAAQAKTPLPKHDAKSIVENLRQTVLTGSIGEIRTAIKLASDFGFKSEHGYIIDQRQYDNLSVGGHHYVSPEARQFFKELADKANKLDDGSGFRINARDFDVALQRAKQSDEPYASSGLNGYAYDFIKYAKKHNDGIDYRDFSWVMQNVVQNVNPNAIDLLVDLANDKQVPFFYHNTFGDMLVSAARSGTSQSIERVLEHADEHSSIDSRSFGSAMGIAAEKPDLERIRQLFTAATQREVRFTANDFVYHVLFKPVNSGDPETLALVIELANEHGLQFNGQHLGELLKPAAKHDEQIVQQVIDLVVKFGVKIDHQFFVAALKKVGKYYSDSAVTELIVGFAAEQGVNFSADDFSLIVRAAASSNNIKGVKAAFELAAAHGFTLGYEHFVDSMEKSASVGYYKTIEQMVRLAAEHGISFNADYFVATMMATESFDYKKLSRINKIANEHGVKLEKEHLSQLLVHAASLVDKHIKKRVDEKVNAVIKLTTKLKFKVDAEYLSAAIAYAKEKRYSNIVLAKLGEIADDYGIEISVE